MMIGYKAVHYNDTTDKHESATLNAHSCIYAIGHKTTRPDLCGPLAVFDRLEDATSFFYTVMGNLRIFKCEYTPSKESYLWKENEREFHLPKGTMLAEDVTLLEAL